MAFTPVAAFDTVQLKVVTFYNNQLGLMLWNGIVNAIVGAPNYDGIFNDVTFTTSLAGAMKALMVNGASYRGWTMKRVTPNPTVEFVNNTQQGPGTAGANPLPTNVSGIISLHTATPGRQGRGRRYVPFPSVSDNDTDGTPTASYVTRLTTLATLLVANWTISAGGGTSFTVVSELMSRKVPFFLRAYTVHAEQKKWANQHRRGSFGRQNLQPF